MKTKQMFGFMIVTLFILTVSLGIAGPGRWGGPGCGGWCTGTPYQGIYNPATLETIAGKVIGIEQTVPMRRMTQGYRSCG
jgi:hypothetical protein